MNTAPRATGDGSTDARRSAESIPQAPDGPRLLKVPLETAQRRTGKAQKQLRALYRRESRRLVDSIMAVDARTLNLRHCAGSYLPCDLDSMAHHNREKGGGDAA